jgi:DNA-binding LytR/AlgR family response regulator
MNTSKKITALIAEDEPLMRDRLRDTLAQAWPELEIVAEAADGLEAIEHFERLKPSVVFLDIRMPGHTGLEVAEEIGDRAHVVFTTAYDEYAVRAFENGAVDFILKPLEVDRLQVTVTRLKKRLDAGAPQDITQLLATLKQTLQPAADGSVGGRMRWIKASLGNQLRMLAVADVQFFQADTKYTRVVLCESEALIRTTLKELLDGLDPDQFWQIHRSTIVNVSAIESVTREGPEKLTVQLKGRKEKLPVSRQFFHLFKQQ